MVNQNIPRYTEAFKLVESRCVVLLDSGHAVVHSLDGKNIYHVNYNNDTCTCPDHFYRQIRCKHILAVKIKLDNREIMV